MCVCACVCLFGSVKASDLAWFMTQKQKLHFTQEQKNLFFNSLWCSSEPHEAVCSIKFTRPDLIPAITFTVWKQLQTLKCVLGGRLCWEPLLCLQERTFWTIYHLDKVHPVCYLSNLPLPENLLFTMEYFNIEKNFPNLRQRQTLPLSQRQTSDK